MAKKKRIKNQGDRLTFLTDEEAELFLRKYERTIYIECRKISHIPGIGIKDLMQECRIKLISGAHTYAKKKSKERTWVLNVIRKTLYSIWNTALAEKRACYVGEKGNGRRPVYDFSLDQPIGGDESEDKSTLSDSYEGSPDGRPIFATELPSPDDSLNILGILEVLKNNLPEESYAYVREQIAPSEALKEIIMLEGKFRKDLVSEGFARVRPKSEYEIFFQFSDVPVEKLQMLCQIGELLCDECGLDKNDILSRDLMIDANF